MSDKIFIRDIKLEVLIGINPDEKIYKQPVIINLELAVDITSAARTDEIEKAVDYAVIHDQVVELVHSSHYNLIETLAEKIASFCLKDKRVMSCKVSVDKPKALSHARSVAIEIFRKQN